MKKRQLGNWFRGLLLLTVALAAGWFVNLRYFKPFNIGQLYDRIFYEFTQDHPEHLTRFNIKNPLITANVNNRLNAGSTEQLQQDQEHVLKQYELLQRYQPDELSTSDAETLSLLQLYLEDLIYLNQFSDYQYAIDPITGVHLQFITFMQSAHRVESLRDAEDYLERLVLAEEKLNVVADKLQQLQETNPLLLPPLPLLESVEAQLEQLMAMPMERHPLFLDFKFKVEQLTWLPEDTRSTLLFDFKRAFEYPISRGYKRLAAEVQSAGYVAPTASIATTDPLWPEYYSFMLKHHLGIDFVTQQVELTTDSLSTLAKTELAQLKTEAADVLRTSPDSVSIALKAALAPDRALYRATASGQASYLNDLRIAYFDAPEALKAFKFEDQVCPLQVEPLAIATALTGETSLYSTPGFDCNRAATLFVDTTQVQLMQATDRSLLLYLQAYPGKHLLFSKHYQSDVPKIRKALRVSSFEQGWQAYLLYYLRQRGDLVRKVKLALLQESLLRAASALADIQLHSGNWTFEQTIQYLQENTGVSAAKAKAQLNKLLSSPGKAPAYLPCLQLMRRGYDRVRWSETLTDSQYHALLVSKGIINLPILQNMLGVLDKQEIAVSSSE